MLRFNKYMKIIYLYWADIPEILAFMSKLIKIENLFIKNPFCNDPQFVLFLDFWPLTNASTQYVIIKVIA